MKKLAIGFGILIVLCIVIGGLSCNETSDATGDAATLSAYEEMTKDTMFADSISDKEDEDSKSLNDIRFADFKDEDWLDNDYIRCLRRYLDDYNNGEIEDEDLEPYKEKIQGKFVIADVEPSLWGGLLVQFMFIDHPEYLFSAYVYSTVDMEKRKVVNYSVHYISVRGNRYEMTTEEILDSLKVHPEMKLW